MFVKQETVCRRIVVVNMENGLHLVPCSRIAQTASKFECAIQITKDDNTVDAKNIFDLMTLNAVNGASLTIQAKGDGAEQLVAALVNLFDTNFAEE